MEPQVHTIPEDKISDIPLSSEKEEAVASEGSDPEGWVDILGTGRLKKRVTSPGTPNTRPEPGDELVVKLSGTHHGEEVLPETEISFRLGEFEVPKALDYILPIMDEKEEAEILSESDFMYGDLGLTQPFSVPPKATLLLRVTLMSSVVPPPNLSLSVEERLALGKRKKDRGTFWYSRSDYQMAIFCYRKASECFEDERIELEVPIDRFELPKDLQELLKERINALNNLAQSQMKNNAWDSSLASLNHVLKIEPNNEKALYRKSRVLLRRSQESEAIGLLRRVTRLYPQNAAAKNELARLLEGRKKTRAHEERLSKKMLGLDKYEEELKKSRSWFNGKMTLKSGLAYFGGLSAVVGLASVVISQYVL
eukprot:TRINITY_DN2308_c0_g1_i1.p1 TRINITY_DN2308_c0_g1~~TRINITY_DN2308_c0_g1_i1.p1  ORF type:complete len:367 (+),score=101.14 TRINITY_DN2308_c0_g1_i1:46-1146(+)